MNTNDPSPDPSPLSSHRQLHRILLYLCVLVSIWLFWYVGGRFKVPYMAEQDASLLLQVHATAAVIVCWIVLGIPALIGTALCGRVHADAGLFCACAGLGAISFRGGSIRDILMAHPDSSAYLILIAETALLWVGILAVSYLIRLVYSRIPVLLPAEERDNGPRSDRPSAPPAWAIASVACQSILMGLLIMLLARSTTKVQVMAAVLVSAGLATALSGSYFHRPRLAAFTCLGPAIVGICGYLLAWSNPGSLNIALPATSLATATPLDYLSMGSAGALFGAWFSRKHQLNWLDQTIGKLTGKPAAQTPATQA